MNANIALERMIGSGEPWTKVSWTVEGEVETLQVLKQPQGGDWQVVADSNVATGSYDDHNTPGTNNYSFKLAGTLKTGEPIESDTEILTLIAGGTTTTGKGKGKKN